MTLLPARTLDSNTGNILRRGSGHTLCRHQTKASLLAIKGWVDRKHAMAPAVLYLCRRQRIMAPLFTKQRVEGTFVDRRDTADQLV